jgi:hypothetical protein
MYTLTCLPLGAAAYIRKLFFNLNTSEIEHSSVYTTAVLYTTSEYDLVGQNKKGELITLTEYLKNTKWKK